MKFETIAIRTQTERGKQNEHSTPIFATSSYLFNDADEMRMIFSDEMPGNVYSRYTNPSVREFENKIALLEHTEDARATTTGMAAIFTAFACLLGQGDHVLMSQAVFGSTIKIMENFFSKWGITYTLVNSENAEDWEEFILPNTRLLYFETPSNPGLQIFRLQSFADMCKKHGIISIVDNCFATPYLQQPAKHGIDMVIHSATKYIDGQGRVMGGVIAGKKEHITAIEQFMRNAGPSLSPFNAWVLSKSLETLAVRMDRHCSNALALAEWLSGQDKIKRVSYPFLESHPSYEIAKQQMKAGGGIVAFELDGDLQMGKNLLNNIGMLSMSANLGDTRSIITHPASTTHSKLTEEQRKLVGINASLIRVSVGLEHIDDIIADVEQALIKA
ncbi:MAG: aminotransferase class I/II-fold pyridoxal phosphate-dependent enzyme [Saprospiraceae bacterium]|nr:aminotransferase class I/II-fold pyridoxal phosphate-dependent enzyme [Saprospiraceae bacterium]